VSLLGLHDAHHPPWLFFGCFSWSAREFLDGQGPYGSCESPRNLPPGAPAAKVAGHGYTVRRPVMKLIRNTTRAITRSR